MTLIEAILIVQRSFPKLSEPFSDLINFRNVLQIRDEVVEPLYLEFWFDSRLQKFALLRRTSRCDNVGKSLGRSLGIEELGFYSVHISRTRKLELDLQQS